MNKKTPVTIFIVEDTHVFANALKADIETAFIGMPFKIHLFKTGEACMKLFKKEKPQIVIVNFHLNNLNQESADGITVLDWVKKENYDTHVIMLTDDDQLFIALKSFQHGAFDYIVKSETTFRKINYSILNAFKMIDAKKDARGYKQIAVGLFLVVALLVGTVMLIQLFTP